MTASSVRNLFAAATLLASAVPALAGGLYVTLGNPEANPKAKAMGAQVTLKLSGCHEPEKAEMTAAAIGIVDGQRKSIPLKLTPLDEPGSYALTRQWPAEGRWVLQFLAKDGERITSTLVAASSGGVDRSSAKMMFQKRPTEEDIAAVLDAGSKSDVARR